MLSSAVLRTGMTIRPQRPFHFHLRTESFQLIACGPTCTTTVKERHMKLKLLEKPRALGLTTFGSRLVSVGISVVVGLGAPAAAVAQIQTYYHAGVWDAFSGRNAKGGAVCGVGNTNPTDNRRLSIRFDIGGTDTVVAVSKPEWSIPDNTRVTVVMQIGLNTPWAETGVGHGNTIDWSMDRSAIQVFDQQFRSASSMTLTFPNGNEPPWTIMLTGSSAISDTFGRCVSDLTRQVQAAQGGSGVRAPEATPGTTQPFSPPPADAPGAAAPGSPPPESAPPGTQPFGPDGAQPGGTQPPR
jgi:hypothetical protein